MQVVVNDLLIHYQEHGHGKVVLLLHGWGDNLSTFQELQAVLSKRFRVVALDLPGFGQSQQPPVTWRLEDYAALVAAFLIKLAVPEVYAVIGHSNGGALAIKALADKTLRAEKLVLLAASGIRTTQPVRRLVLKAIAKTGKAATVMLPQSTRRRLRQKLYGTIGSDMLVAPHMQETFKLTVRQDISSEAAHVSVPALLLYGTADTATPPAIGKRFQELIPGSRLVLVDGAEHFIHHDQPNKVIEAITEFLA